MAGIKVGEGYIEITPKVTGVNRDLVREIQSRLNGLDKAKFQVAPKVSGITKRWQSEIQKDLNTVIDGLTVAVRVRLDKTNLTATFGDVTVSATQAGTEAGDGLADGFKQATNDIKRMMRETEVAIKAGVLPAGDDSVRARLNTVSSAYKDLADDIGQYTDSQVSIIRSGVNEMSALNRLVASNTKTQTESIRTEFAKIAPAIRTMSNDSIQSLSKFERGILSVEKTVKLGFKEASAKGLTDVAQAFKSFADGNGIDLPGMGQKAGRSFGGALADAVDTTVRFGLARLVVGLPLALAGLGYAMAPLASAVSSLAAGFTALGSQAVYAFGALAALPAVMGLIVQATSVMGFAFFGVQEALGALQAEQDKSGQAAATMAAAIEAASRRAEQAQRALADAQSDSARRIADARENLQRIAETVSERISGAQERVAEVVRSTNERIIEADARLADVRESVGDRIADATERLARVQEDGSERIRAAQERLSEAIEQTNERIQSAEERLAQAKEDSTRRIEDAQRRLAKAHEDGARRVVSAEGNYKRSIEDVKEAQDALNEARAEARERLEDLALAVSGGALDEESARNAVNEAAEHLRNLNLNPEATDKEKAEADFAYRQAVQRLREVQERNGDLREEQEKASKEGVEGSREVTSAKDALQRAIQRQIDAEKALVDARREASEGIIDAERDLKDARDDSARGILDAERDLARARQDGAKAILDAEKSLRDAREDAARSVTEAERSLNRTREDGAKQIADAELAAVRARQDAVRQVEAAEKALTDARKSGTRDVADAERALADARVNGARQVEDAQRSLREAMEAVAQASEKQSVQASNAEAALKKLSPAAREFVLFLDREFLPKLREIQWSIQEAFFPPLQQALAQSDGLLDLFKVKLTDTATIFGGFALRFSDWLNTDESKNKIGRILDSNNRLFARLSDAALDAADATLTLVDGSSPFLERMGDLIGRLVGRVKDLINEAARNGELEKFFNRVGDTIDKAAEIAWDLGRALYGIFDTAYPSGKRLLDLIGDTAKEFADWVNSVEGKQTLKEWFKKGEDVMRELLALVKDIAKAFFDLGNDVDFSKILKALREDFLPAVVKLAKAFSGDNGDGLIITIRAFADVIEATAVLVEAFGSVLGLLGLKADGAASPLEHLGVLVDIVGGSLRFFTGDTKALGETFGTVTDKISRIGKDVFGKTLPEALGISEKEFEEIKNTGSRAFDILSENVVHAFGEIVRTLRGESSDITRWVNDRWRDLESGASRTWNDISSSASRTWDGISRTISDYASRVWSNAVSNFTRMKDDIARTLQDALNWVYQWGPWILAAITGIGPGLWRAGFDIIQGLWNGVAAKWNEFINWWNANINNISEIARRVLGINSPSRVMAAIGRGVGEGLVLGLQSTEGMVASATKSMADSVTGSWGKVVLPIESKLPNLDMPQGGTYAGQRVYRPLAAPNGRGDKNYNITLNAAPTIPTERQITNVLKYADALYPDE
ncbi:hypothetical protein [Nonomuraea recticatena]|uniref:Tape measure protein n=1 Tax=Nonomuraea recticatena TaxID=46178 RepID=A0ABP6EED4_9ACTN